MLVGEARSGKDTAAELLSKYFSEEGQICARLAFADPIKRGVSALLGVDQKILDEFKNQQNSFIGLNIRRLYQDIGMFLRSQNEDIYVELMIDRIEHLKNEVDIIFITDTRFPNEHDIIKSRYKNMYSIKIERPNRIINPSLSQHVSETSVSKVRNINEIVINDGSLDQLKEKLYQKTVGRIRRCFMK